MKGKGKKAAELNPIEGGDVLIGTSGADIFILREGQGDLTVEGFQPGIDRVMFDFSSYSDVLGPLGRLYDGLTFDDFTGGTHFVVSAVDANGDGITDTRFDANEDSITLLGVGPDLLFSGSLMGG
jgi:hypothetical protein